jgi:hypothetical protein
MTPFICSQCCWYRSEVSHGRRVEAGQNTSTIALRILGGDEMGTSCAIVSRLWLGAKLTTLLCKELSRNPKK